MYCAPDVGGDDCESTPNICVPTRSATGPIPHEVANAIAALRTPDNPVRRADVDLGGVDGGDQPSGSAGTPVTT